MNENGDAETNDRQCKVDEEKTNVCGNRHDQSVREMLKNQKNSESENPNSAFGRLKLSRKKGMKTVPSVTCPVSAQMSDSFSRCASFSFIASDSTVVCSPLQWDEMSLLTEVRG